MSEVLEAVAYKSEALKRKLARLLEERSIRDKLERYWFRLTPGAAESTGIFDSWPIIVSAVDGGNNRRSLLSFDVYVVKASAQGYAVGRGGNTERAFTKRIVDVDFMIPTENSADRLTLYRQVAEMKLLYYSLERSDLVLGDGSLESLVTRPIHAKLGLLDEPSPPPGLPDCGELEAVVRRDLESNPYQAMSVKGLVEELATNASLGRDEVGRRVAYLETLEKATALKLMLERVEASKSLLVFVTKTGRSRKFFGAPVSDQYVLSVYSREAGYYLNEDASFEKPREMLKELPKKCGLRELGEDLAYVRGLVRLEDRSPVLGIEVVYNPETTGFRPRDAFLGVIGVLGLVSPGGYPQLLYVVDRETHIENKDVERVMAALGLSHALTGREVLEYE